MIQPRRYPPFLMPSLIHEAAHWECFLTPVGTALTKCYIRAWKYSRLNLAGFHEVGDRSTDYEAALEYTRYKLVTEALRPISEGIALFTEFDSLPIDSAVTFETTRLIGTLFGAWRREEAPSSTMTLGEVSLQNLLDARSGSNFRSRKENLLCQKFETNGGGYLPGYYFVKNLQYYLVFVRGLKSLIDGDLFLYLLKSVIFGDLYLAALILDSDEDISLETSSEFCSKMDFSSKLYTRFQENLEFLIHDVDDAFLHNIEEQVTQGEQLDWRNLQRGSAAALTPALRKIEREIVNIESLGENELGQAGKIGPLELQHHAVLANRSLLCIASFNAFVRVNEYGRCLVYKGEDADISEIAFAVSALISAAPLEAVGDVYIYWNGIAGQEDIITAVYAKGKPVACFSANPASDLDTEAFTREHISPDVIKQLFDGMQVAIDQVTEDHPISDHYISQIEDVNMKIYTRYVAAFLEFGGRGDANQIIERKSLIELLDDDDLEMLSLYAEASLIAGILLPKEEFSKLCRKYGLSPVEVLTRFERIRKEKGFPFFSETEGGLIFRI